MVHLIANGVMPVWQQLEARTIETMPAVAASLLMLAIGILLGWGARRTIGWLLRGQKTAWPADALGLGWSRAAVVGRSVQWFIIFGSTIVALYALDPRLASTLAEKVLLYVPHLAGACLIVAVGVLLSRFVGRSVLIAAVNHDIRSARMLASLTRTAIVILSVAIGLEHAGIGQRTVLVAFGILFGGLTLTASIALGLALQDPVRRWLAEQEDERGRHRRDTETMHHV